MLDDLIEAVESNSLSKVKEIVEQGVENRGVLDESSEEFLISLVRKGDLDEIERFVSSLKVLNQALLMAVELDRLEIVKYLVDAGAEISMDRYKPLRSAAYYGHLEIIKYFIEEKKIDIHADEDAILRIAAERGHLDLVEYAYSKGADLNASGGYALLWAAYNGHSEIVEWLLDHGADPNVKGDDDYILQWLVDKDQLDLAAKVVSYGADTSILSSAQKQKLDAYILSKKTTKTRKL